MPETQANPMQGRPPAHASLWAAGVYCLTLLLLFHETTWSMVSIWLRSDTFAHGFLILPISLWLVWNQRDHLRLIIPSPALWVALLMIPPGFVWLLAWLVDVLVVQQLALVAMLIVGAWAIMGHQLASALAFPLLFLFLAVPMGEALIPPMMEFTATSTVWLIQQTGIPVYREGLYFTLPSGNWSVVEACSGVRYIIASVTLGILYAYLTYRSLWRRALFVLVSAIVPVFANTARAYIIVMLGHMSDMTVATGVDHLIYGWVFFGLVIFLLFWLGSFFREDVSAAAGDGSLRSTSVDGARSNSSRLLVTTTVALLAAVVWPLLSYIMASRADANSQVVVTLPHASGAWQSSPLSAWLWQPESVVAGQVAAYYGLDGQTLGLFIQYSNSASDDGEVVGSSTRFTNQEGGMRVVSRDRVTLKLGSEAVLVDQAHLRGMGEELLGWSWYRVGDLQTSNDYLAKLGEAWTSFGFGPAASYRIVLALPLQGSVATTQALLQEFMDEHGQELGEALQRSMESQ